MKDIPGFGGKYKISDSGEVVGPSGRILKPRCDKDGYLRLNMMHPKKGRDTYLIHRLVMLTYRGETPEGCCIDHIDGNKRNNYIGNLRFARPCQNAWNSRRRKGGSGVIGVHKNKGKFQARISVNKKRIYLGQFNSPEVAAVARDSAARLFHGEFALCNYPTG